MSQSSVCWKDYQPLTVGISLLFSAAISPVPQRNPDASTLPLVLPVPPPLFSALAAFLRSAGLAGRRGGEALGV